MFVYLYFYSDKKSRRPQTSFFFEQQKYPSIIILLIGIKNSDKHYYCFNDNTTVKFVCYTYSKDKIIHNRSFPAEIRAFPRRGQCQRRWIFFTSLNTFKAIASIDKDSYWVIPLLQLKIIQWDFAYLLSEYCVKSSLIVLSLQLWWINSNKAVITLIKTNNTSESDKIINKHYQYILTIFVRFSLTIIEHMI